MAEQFTHDARQPYQANQPLAVSDPTVLTTEQLLREIERVKEYVLALVVGGTNTFEEKLVAVKGQFSLLEKWHTDQVTLIDRQRQHQFNAIETRIASVDVSIATQREYFEALFREKERALDMAAEERERSAMMLRDEQQRAMGTAEQEREKSAAALRNEMSRSVEEGDRNLREHILAQVGQIREAMISAEKLEMQRFDAVKKMIEGVQREIEISAEASAAAILKAEIATEKRFSSVNEFRAQLTDQANTFLPRETFESVVLGWSEWRRAIDERLNQQKGSETTTEKRKEQIQPWQIWASGALVTFINVVVIIVANILTAMP